MLLSQLFQLQLERSRQSGPTDPLARVGVSHQRRLPSLRRASLLCARHVLGPFPAHRGLLLSSNAVQRRAGLDFALRRPASSRPPLHRPPSMVQRAPASSPFCSASYARLWGSFRIGPCLDFGAQFTRYPFQAGARSTRVVCVLTGLAQVGRFAETGGNGLFGALLFLCSRGARPRQRHACSVLILVAD